ncbi:MAG: SCO1664 family protein [Acidimicrobiia bacterium]
MLEFLAESEMDIEGRMPWSSNATFLVNLCLQDQRAQGIYKPMRGERPLWDFEPGLHRRERAAFVLSEGLGWNIVPPTVIRDGPYGEGSVQLFIEADYDEHYFTLHEGRPDLHDQLQRICAFDVIANNTDRKGGHCLLGTDGHVYGIDHGVCFSADFKLRTVIWEFGGEPIPDEIMTDVERVAENLPSELSTLLNREETLATQRRAWQLVEHPYFPVDRTGRRYPWPLV